MRRPTRRRLMTWIPLFVAFAAAWLVLSMDSVQEFLILRSDPPLGNLSDTPTGQLPADVRFTCVDGTVLSAQSLRGRPAVINVFATWCPPCVAEVPSLERLRSTMGAEATVLMVGIDEPEQLSIWTRTRNGDPAAFATTNTFDPPMDTLSIPMTLVLDAQGNVVAKVTGAFRWDGPAVIQRLRALGQ